MLKSSNVHSNICNYSIKSGTVNAMAYSNLFQLRVTLKAREDYTRLKRTDQMKVKKRKRIVLFLESVPSKLEQMFHNYKILKMQAQI